MRLTHVAVTVPADRIIGAERERLLEYYAEVLGWTENPELSIPGRRILLRAPSDAQYLTIKASDAPMTTSGSEHVGVSVDSDAELAAVHERAVSFASRDPEASVEPIRTLYGGALRTFRLGYALPLTIEMQFFPRRSA